MCGITGWIDWERDLTREETALAAMAATLACRGPDAGGLWLSRHAALGHRRLAVVDPAGGSQPMVRQRPGPGGGTLVLTYNGELYNTPELRRELLARGHRFAGHSDTEVLLASYMEWGPACLDRLNGIFAFAVWDDAAESLFMARDRLGVKPLFYARRGRGLLFGSELKALLAHPAVRPEVDSTGLAEVLVLGPGRTPGHGVLRGVAELKPGHWLRFDREGLRQGPYWQLVSRPHRESLESTAAQVRWLLQDAVERQLVADVSVCTLLSGGLDSSAITAMAATAFQLRDLGPLHTYSVDYAGNDQHFRPNDFIPEADGPWIARVAAALGTRHRNVVIPTAELAAALLPAMRARDLPGMADIDGLLYLLSRAVKAEATVALSGECADEIFGGYPWFRRPEALAAETFPWLRGLEQRVRLLVPEVVTATQPFAYAAARYQEALAEVPRLEGEPPAAARRREIGYLTLTRWMPVLLDRKDRMSMAAGLEVRVPFCDHRLVEYAWNIPWEMKSCDGQEKGVLRRALAGVLPEDVRNRRKSPYPKTHNPLYLSLVRERLQAVLADPASPLRPLLNLREVERLLRAEGDPFGPAWFGQLMGLPQLLAYLVQVDGWLREYRIALV